jgi:hypothetical protein
VRSPHLNSIFPQRVIPGGLAESMFIDNPTFCSIIIAWRFNNAHRFTVLPFYGKIESGKTESPDYQVT